MRQNFLTTGLILGAIIAILVGLWKAPIVFFDVLAWPVQTLFGPPQPILINDPHQGPMRGAARRILRPYGLIKRVRYHPVPTSTDVPVPEPKPKPPAKSPRS